MRKTRSKRQRSKRRKNSHIRKKKSKFRKSRKRKSRKRKSRKRKSRKRTRKRSRFRRKKRRGGGLAPLNKDPYLPNPRSTQSDIPIPYAQSGGAGVLDGWGLGDLVRGYYGAGNTAQNYYNRWGGKKKVSSSDPLDQPRMLENKGKNYKVPDWSRYNQESGMKAAKYSLIN
jgi:hypothetical protein